ncbi:UDP-4-amino-4,6-dideoxy-N-acetyl-beta-L-altrosamine transaminase [bacterium]|nr:MAG: UDP-4-amino-4,6-dideoxy-N-acetyl-beta-L-altrosamine transaminase [bacterium]
MKRISYGRQSIDGSDIKAVAGVLMSDWLTQGPKVKEFEDALCKYTGARYAVAVSNGTAALHLACLAAGLKAGDEAITSPITFVASANCILYCRAKPIFADIREETVNIDPKEIQKKLTKKTKVLIPVHFAGYPYDMEEINRIAKKHDLVIIEDACHALGAEYKGSKIGSCQYSDMAVFSFHPVKSITTGEGGAILTNNRKYYEKLLLLRTHGITKEKSKLKNKGEGSWYYEMQELGFNYRITDLQCALGISQLKRIKSFMAKRRKIADIYDKNLSAMKNISLPYKSGNVKSARHIYYILLKDYRKKKDIFNKLQAAGIHAQVHYIPVHLQPYYRENFGYKTGDYKKAEAYYHKAITLPLYPGLKLSEAEYVLNILRKAL